SRSTRSGERTDIHVVDADFIHTPDPGRSLLTNAPAGPALESSTPDPARWDGARPAIGPACAGPRGLEDAVRLGKVLLQCSNAPTFVQYVQIDRTSPLAGMPPGLLLRLRDRDDRVLGERDQLFSNTPGPFWGSAPSIVVGGPQFA